MTHATHPTARTRDAALGATASALPEVDCAAPPSDDEILMLFLLLVERCRAGEHSWRWTGRTTPDESGAVRQVLGCQVCSARKLGDLVRKMGLAS